MKEADTKGELIKSIVNKDCFFIAFIITTCCSCSILKPAPSINIQSNITIAKNYLKYIDSIELNENLSILASDEFEGRETSMPGQKKAAKFISDYFYKNGISTTSTKSYYQKFNVKVRDYTRIKFILNKDTLGLINDFYSIGGSKDTALFLKEIINVNYGVVTNEHNDYLNKNVDGKIVLINENIPDELNKSHEWNNWRKKVRTAMEHGAVGVITNKIDYKKSIGIIKPYLLNPEMFMHYEAPINNNLIPYLCISNEVYKKLLNQPPINATIDIDFEYFASTENVIGYIEGTDKKEELIVISAHYDHLGYDNGEICNGADDDGSGTVSLMSIANAFQNAKNNNHPPRRSILFLAVSGEEKGLFGSKFYTDNPIYPLENTVANLNIDMVGRKDTIHNNTNYIYIIGSDKISKELHFINEKINKDHIGFELDYTYNKDNDPNHFYYRSDHYNFAKNNIPVIFYFSGIHRDYHKPTDDVDKINFQKLEKTARYVFLTAWELANRETRIK